MKILTVCFGGNVRSVGMARFLKTQRGHDAIAMGWAYNSTETKAMLFAWADLIIVMTERMLVQVPPPLHDKTRVCDVGDDRYHNHMHPDLQAQCKAWVEKEGL